MVKDNKITRTIGKNVIEEIFNSKKSAQEIVNEKDLLQVEDSSFINSIVDRVIFENAKVVDDILRNPNAIKFLVGQVMKISKGKINPKVAEEKLKAKI
jgi:aspartyl-tRNA(Asn)/glutamyl-tRNA(Gln) amidotransferase subunit B